MKAKKIFMTMLSILLLYFLHIPLMGYKYNINTELVVTYTEQDYINMLQSALNNFGMPFIPLSFDKNLDDHDDLVDQIMRGFESYIHDVMAYIVKTINFDSITGRRLVVRDLQHDFIENIVVEIGLHVSSLSYSVCLINLGLITSDKHEYINRILVTKNTYLYEYMDAPFALLNGYEGINAYNKTEQGSEYVRDVFNKNYIVGSVEGIVRYFIRDDGMKFVEENRYDFFHAIIDNKLLKSISFDYITIRDNGTKNPDIRFGYRVFPVCSHINATTHELRVFL